MRLSCSSTALLLLCGGECGGDVDEFNIAVVFISEKKKEEDARRVHSCIRKQFYNQLVWEEKAKWMRKIGSRRGRKRRMSAEDCLGLVLLWTRSRGLL
eukprot:1748098-Ditylum_brightwellii.AAC.1